MIVQLTSRFCVLQRHEERVIIISSKDSDNIFSDAENALHQIVSLILKVMWYAIIVLSGLQLDPFKFSSPHCYFVFIV